MSQHGERIRELYEAALTKPPGERSSFVARVAGPDTELRERVEALLSGQQDTVLPGYEPGADQSEQLLTPGTQIGSYRIEGPLGAGGMGVVYFATDTKLNRPAAIKVLPENLADPEARQRFQREAQLVSSLNHPHILTVYDAGEHAGREYLITEYVDGGTLRQWAQRPRGWRGIVELLVGVADGIAVAHEAGILHRDIKPENILLAKNGYAKLADFGIAKLLESDPLADDPALPRAGGLSTHVGTLAYMSPEQWQGLPLDARSDVYSFGLVLHELLAGGRLEAPAPTLPRKLPSLPPEVPAELRTLVAKALETDPADRYQTMRELVVDLRRLVRYPGVDTGGAPIIASPRRSRARTIGYVIAALAMLAVVALVGRAALRGVLNDTASPRAVAVLPFVNEGTNADDASISERLSDRLRDRLQELPDIDVIGRVSSLSFRDQPADVRAIAASLGAGRLVNGSLQRRGAMLDVRVEIVDERGVILHQLSYEEPDTALLALQQKISDEVGRYFAPTSPASAATPAPLGSQSEQANRLILFGTRLENAANDDISIDQESLEKAIAYYRQATQADPTSIEAYSRLAAALLYNVDVAGAIAALNRALELGESLGADAKSADLSRAYYTAGLYLIGAREDGAETQYQRALELNPNNVDALGAYAQWLMTHNGSPKADEYFNEAIRLEPQSLRRYTDYAEFLGTRDEIDSLRQLAATMEKRFANARGHFALARVYELTGDLDVGIAYGLMAYRTLHAQEVAAVQSAVSQNQFEDVRGQLAELYAEIGEFDKASEFEPEPGIGQLLWRREYDKLTDVAQDRAIERPDDVDAQYYLAFAYNATGDFTTAKYLLEQLHFPRPEGSAISGTESQALTYYIDALQSLGGNDATVRALALKRVELFSSGVRTGMGNSWWVNMSLACSEAQLDRVPEALAAITRVDSAGGLPPLHQLLDSPCFKRLANEPPYIALIEHIKERQRMLRDKVPATLAQYGVADVRP
jgi:serine/threonine protein kinase/cytochrome c-type biogenesis protein CcmH/NrfG